MTIPHTKFWIAVGILVVASVFRATGLLGESEWVTTALAVIGMYSAANVGATIAHRSGNVEVPDVFDLRPLDRRRARATVTRRGRAEWNPDPDPEDVLE